MKSRILTALSILVLNSACNAPAASVSSLASTSGSFSVKTSKASLAYLSGGTVQTVSDLASGMGTIGDTSSEPKRVLITFPISSLAGKTVSNAKLRLTYDSKSGTTVVTNMGSVYAWKVASHSSFVASDYAAAELTSFLVAGTDAAVNAAVQGSQFDMDITSALQTSINAGDAYFTVKVRFQTDVNQGSNAVNWYTHYSSVPLDAKIPRIVGDYQ